MYELCLCVCVTETIARRAQDETTIGTNVSVLCSRNKMFARRNAYDRKAPVLAGEQCRRNASAASDRVVYTALFRFSSFHDVDLALPRIVRDTLLIPRIQSASRLSRIHGKGVTPRTQ